LRTVCSICSQSTYYWEQYTVYVLSLHIIENSIYVCLCKEYLAKNTFVKRKWQPTNSLFKFLLFLVTSLCFWAIYAFLVLNKRLALLFGHTNTNITICFNYSDQIVHIGVN